MKLLVMRRVVLKKTTDGNGIVDFRSVRKYSTKHAILTNHHRVKKNVPVKEPRDVSTNTQEHHVVMGVNV